jgi:hypothetical protein
MVAGAMRCCDRHAECLKTYPAGKVYHGSLWEGHHAGGFAYPEQLDKLGAEAHEDRLVGRFGDQHARAYNPYPYNRVAAHACLEDPVGCLHKAVLGAVDRARLVEPVASNCCRILSRLYPFYHVAPLHLVPSLAIWIDADE